jgi:phosphoglycerate dehydrogenase-like enzyme
MLLESSAPKWVRPAGTSSVWTMAVPPRVAVEPEGTRAFLSEAVRAGGGEVVEPAQAEGLVWTQPHNPSDLAQLLSRHPSIRWVQLPWAGIEPMVTVIDRHRLWTAAQGVYAEEVAEHALALSLAGLRHLAAFARATEWGSPAGQNLLGARVTILGAGGIATALLRLLEPFRCHVTVLRRKPDPLPGAERTATLAELPSVTADTDLLILALALTPETTGIIDRSRLAELPRTAWIVNVARGGHVVTDDLVDALREGRIGGAALDVTDPEPLPPDHPLWALPNCLITPHTANTPQMAAPVLARRITENVRRFGRGDELLGVVDIDGGY